MKKEGKYVIELTTIGSDSTGKVPYSPYNDNSFDFETIKFTDLKSAFLEMKNSFTLSKALRLDSVKRMSRLTKDLKKYKLNEVHSIALDLDNIYTQQDYEYVIDYFKSKDYPCILGKSRGWNGTTKYNIKGIIRVKLRNEPSTIKNALGILQDDLGVSCNVDLTVGNTVSLQAPTTKTEIIYYNEKGKEVIDNTSADKQKERNKIRVSNKIPEILIGNISEIEFTQDIKEVSLNIFRELGYNILNNNVNENGSINFVHGSEVTSPGGYFWFPNTSPFIMHHNNKHKSINIFYLIKETKEGKIFLKNLNNIEQREQLSRKYEEATKVEQRYLEVSTDISKKINNFLETPLGVFKIVSAMGTGKSNLIGAIIEEARAKRQSILVISNRRSVAQDFSEKYSMNLYSSDTKHINGASLVVQFDSLWKYDLEEFDLVIMDEFMSLLLHHRGNLTDNSNLNIAKFYVALKKKRLVIADAFLSGLENQYIKNRKQTIIVNKHRDNISLYDYKNKNNFLKTLTESLDNREKGQTLSASFMSVNVLRVVEAELIAKGYKVITLTSDTSDITKGLIYEKFSQYNNTTWDAILYTPTLTVGVSNLNNVKYHFHYDTGNAGGVIDSLQMVKRPRNAKEIHFYLETRQKYNDTNVENLNISANESIKTYYKNKDKTLLVDLDYNTGNFSLNELGKYINSIEVINNILENNHANAFRVLLQYQFNSKPIVNEDIDTTFNITKKTKEVKAKLKEEKLKELEEFSGTTWTPEEIIDIHRKTGTLTKEERVKILLDKVQSKFTVSLPQFELNELAKLEIESNFNFIKSVKKLNLVIKPNSDYILYKISNAVSGDISSLQDTTDIKFLEHLLTLGNDFKLSEWYSKKELKDNKQFENMLKSVGYTWINNKLKLNKKMLKYTKYLEKN